MRRSKEELISILASHRGAVGLYIQNDRVLIAYPGSETPYGFGFWNEATLATLSELTRKPDEQNYDSFAQAAEKYEAIYGEEFTPKQ